MTRQGGKTAFYFSGLTEGGDLLKQPHTRVHCSLYNKENMFYFILDASGNPLPNYCEDWSGAPECSKCAVMALDQLIKQTKNVFDYEQGEFFAFCFTDNLLLLNVFSRPVAQLAVFRLYP